MTLQCPVCDSYEWDWSNVGLPNTVQCTDCGSIYAIPKKPWVEITKGQIDECLQHSDNYGSTPYDFAWAIEAMCKKNNGYAPHENFKPDWS
jgi:hypothetical protein